MRRRLAVSAVLAAALLGSAALPVFAECMNWPLRASERARIAFAFTGTVTNVVKTRYSDDPDWDPHLSRYRVTVDVGRQYRGRVPESLELIGTNFGCSFFAVGGLVEGDRLFIASEQFETGRDETWFGDVLAWRRTGDRWVFYGDVLRDGSDPDFYPKEARAATTTADILGLIARSPLPDTSTEPPPVEPARPTALPGLVFLFLASLGVAMRRLERFRSA